MLKREDVILFSGGALGAEEAFGQCAESFGIEEVNFSFEGHKPQRTRGLRVLNHEELAAGEVSLAYVSKLMNRRYPDTPTFRKILQSIWYQINNGQEIYVIGAIQPDQTVRGGTGWGAEFAKLCNKPLFVFDQEKSGWFAWDGDAGKWNAQSGADAPLIQHVHFTGTGTRMLAPAARQAITDLFTRSFK
jgi:hypothetical protein